MTKKTRIETVEVSPQATCKLVRMTTLGDCYGVAKLDHQGLVYGIAWSTEGSARNSYDQMVAKEVQS